MLTRTAFLYAGWSQTCAVKQWLRCCWACWPSSQQVCVCVCAGDERSSSRSRLGALFQAIVAALTNKKQSVLMLCGARSVAAASSQQPGGCLQKGGPRPHFQKQTHLHTQGGWQYVHSPAAIHVCWGPHDTTCHCGSSATAPAHPESAPYPALMLFLSF